MTEGRHETIERLSSPRLWLAAAAVLLLTGGPMHPDPDTSLDFDTSTAHMLRDSGWIPAHALLLASFVCLTVGLVSLTRQPEITGRLRRLATVAAGGAALAVVELTFHLLAFTEADALAAGRSAPIVSTHLALAVVAYPVAGLSLAALAWYGGRARVLTHPIAGAVGVLGGLLHALAAPIVVLSRDQNLSFLFMGAVLLVPWLLAAALRRRQPVVAAAAPA